MAYILQCAKVVPWRNCVHMFNVTMCQCQTFERGECQKIDSQIVMNLDSSNTNLHIKISQYKVCQIPNPTLKSHSVKMYQIPIPRWQTV